MNTTNKPCLTENSDQESDMGATQRRQPAKSQQRCVAEIIDPANTAVFRIVREDLIAA
ncbi:hypothetical protein [Rhizobium leguminosarum]